MPSRSPPPQSTRAARFARPVEELLERGSLFDLFEESEQLRIRALIADRIARGQPVPEQFETVVVRPDGSLLPVELSIKAVVDGKTTRTYTLSPTSGRVRPSSAGSPTRQPTTT